LERKKNTAMAIFVIIPQPNPNSGKLPMAVGEAFKDSVYPLEGDKGWLVSWKGTAQEISENLGITSGVNGGALILEVASYFGRANPNIWTWIKNKLEAPPSG
jgi:hypothetical protein